MLEARLHPPGEIVARIQRRRPLAKLDDRPTTAGEGSR